MINTLPFADSNDKIIDKTKSIAKELGCSSLRSLASIAGKVAFEVIQSQL